MRRSASAGVAAVSLLAATAFGAAQAASGNWNNVANGPTIYQTNWQYNSSWMTPPGYVPATATVTSVSWTVKFSYLPSGLTSYLHPRTTNLYYQLPGPSGSGTLTGIPAKQDMRFAFVVQQPTTTLLSPPAYGGGHQLNVNY